MSLEDFFRECERKGAIPLRYRCYQKFANGSRTVEYENPLYKSMKGMIPEMPGAGKGNAGSVISELCGQDVVIRTKDGFHYGNLRGYDGEAFMLESHLYAGRLMDRLSYLLKGTLFRGKSAVPAKDVISVSEIPLWIANKNSQD